MTELDSIKALDRYDQYKKAKKSRKRWISLISVLIGGIIALLLTWAILRVGVGSVWTLTKAGFASEEKIMEHVPKINQIEDKLKKSIVKKPLNWLSKKVEEEAAKEVLKGNLGGIVDAIRTYAIILIIIWIIVWAIIYTIFYYLSYWIISRFVWLEPTMSEQEI